MSTHKPVPEGLYGFIFPKRKPQTMKLSIVYFRISYPKALIPGTLECELVWK